VFFTESFEALTPETAGLKYAPLIGSDAYTAGTYTHVTGPFVGRAARFAGAGNWLAGAGVYASDPSGPTPLEQQSAGFAAHVRLSAGAPGDDVVLVQAMQADTLGGGPASPQQSLLVLADGTVEVRLGDAAGGVLVASGAGAVPRGAWVHLEYRTALAAPADDLEGALVAVRVDGAEVARVTGVATVPDAPNRLTHYRFGAVGPTGSAVVVDLDDVVYYGWGPENDPEEWLGPKAVATLFPIAPGSSTELTVAGAPENWAAVAEAPPDGDATYVAKPAGSRPVDMYRLTPLPAFAPTTEAGTTGTAAHQLIGWYVLRAESGTGDGPSRTGYRRLGFTGGGGRPAMLWTEDDVTLSGEYRAVTDFAYPLEPDDPPAFLASLEAGLGAPSEFAPGADEGAYRCTQLTVDFVCQLAPPPAAGRTQVFWVP
jgi:hypothetical protein